MASNRVLSGQVLISHVEDESTQVELTLKPETKPTSKALALKVALRMSEGDGEESYRRNSWLQGGILRDIGSDLAEELNNMPSLPTEGSPVRVADFGCSTGPNTLAWADLAASCVQHNIQSKICAGGAASPVEIQHFFNDLPSNDWNTLHNAVAALESRPYFASTVAGSFYESLFPKGSLHIAISTWAVQYLSVVSPKLI